MTVGNMNNRRILLVDDLENMHKNYREILHERKSVVEDALASFDAKFFDEETEIDSPKYELDSAFQGLEAHQKVTEALKNSEPYALAFVDVRMPPGWDGIETIKRLWEVDSEIIVVICTAYADYSWKDIYNTFGRTDKLVLLRKPFDPAEIRQLALTLTEKWNLNRKAALKMSDLDEMVKERTIKLEEALLQVKSLSGLLPICAHCKKIRDDKGYWNQLETYISTHSEADFSHGICPGCLQEHYSKYK